MLETSDLTISYTGRPVVSDVTFAAESGRVTALLGRNGAGKTTLLRALNGGIVPIAGEVRLNGIALSRYSRRAVARVVAVVAQETSVAFPVSVLEFVLGGRFSAGKWFGWETDEDIELARIAIRETGLVEFETRLMNELSGGERQRAVIARALASGASVLLLDEPTANLDIAEQAKMLARIRSRCSSSGASAVFVTHDLNLAAEFASEVLLLKDGCVFFKGKPWEAFRPELIQEVFGLKVVVDSHPVSGTPRITPVHEGLN